MKKLLSLLLVLALCIGLPVLPAAADTSGDWEYTINDGKATITKYNGPGGVVSVPSTLGSCPVTEIGNNAFKLCSGLTKAVIPEGVTSIGFDAFFRCEALESVELPDSLQQIKSQAFYNTALLSVSIPSGVTSVDGHAFSTCQNLTAFSVDAKNKYYQSIDGVLYTLSPLALAAFPYGKNVDSYTIASGTTAIYGTFANHYRLKSVTIPVSVKEIAGAVFAGNDSLKDVYFGGTEESWNLVQKGDNNTSLTNASMHYGTDAPPSPPAGGGGGGGGGGTPGGEVVPEDWLYSIQDGEVIIQRYIGHGATITIPSVLEGCPVTSIGSSAFQSCTSVECITIPNGVKSIGLQAFWMCGNLKTITIPESVTSIGSLAFGDCSSLTAVVIPNGVTGIEKSTFSGCSSLKTVEIPNTVTTIGENAFYKCSALESVTIPDQVTSIGRMAFEGCSSITSVTVPSGVTSISDYAFSSCSNLKSASLPNGVTSIGQSAFMHCGLLENLVIPNSVTSIGAGAFQDCSSLTSINIPRGVTRIENYAFMRCGFTSIVLPDGVTYIGDGAFSTCKSLKTVWIPASLKEIGKSVFNATTGALTDIYYGGSEAQWKEIVIGDNNSYLTRVTIHYDTVPPTPVPVTPSQPTADPWITAAEYADDALTLTAKNGVTAPVFLAAYDKESGKMAGVYPAECKDGQYTLPIGADAAEYDWKLMFVDARSSAPLTCDYRLTFPA